MGINVHNIAVLQLFIFLLCGSLIEESSFLVLGPLIETKS